MASHGASLTQSLTAQPDEEGGVIREDGRVLYLRVGPWGHLGHCAVPGCWIWIPSPGMGGVAHFDDALPGCSVRRPAPCVADWAPPDPRDRRNSRKQRSLCHRPAAGAGRVRRVSQVAECEMKNDAGHLTGRRLRAAAADVHRELLKLSPVGFRQRDLLSPGRPRDSRTPACGP